jgi:hypothetical protein
LRVVVTGLIAQHPRLGGMTWHYLHYLLGLQKLGHEVMYLEDSGQWPYVLEGSSDAASWIAYDCSPNVDYLAAIMERFGLTDRWAYRFPIADEWFGIGPARRTELLRTADVILNVSGTLEDPGRYRGAARLVYIDTDPVFTQLEIAYGEHTDFAARVAAHDVHFTFAAHAGLLHPTPYAWLTTRQPIDLSEWQLDSPSRDDFTTVMSWASYAPKSYGGEVYGQKDVEFLRFLDLPSRVSAPLEVALPSIRHPEWEPVAWEQRLTLLPADALARLEGLDWNVPALLESAGWRCVNAFEAVGDLDRYRGYIATSKGEWTVAKNLYVRGQVGWFSERSACYLAAGKPVVTQDTGLEGALPTGDGLLTFRTLDDAAAGIEQVNGSYARHARAARELAREYFDAERVLSDLLEEAAPA